MMSCANGILFPVTSVFLALAAIKPVLEKKGVLTCCNGRKGKKKSCKELGSSIVPEKDDRQRIP